VSANYVSAGLDVRAIYEEIRGSDGKLNNLYSASRLYVAGASYTWQNLKLFFGYSGIRSNGSTDADSSNPSASTRSDMLWGGANYAITPELELLGGVYRVWVNNDGGSATLAAFGATYLLSKRTMLSATVGTVFNNGRAIFPVEYGTAGPQPGGNQQGVYVGMVNSF
jgi:predicted porin